jgi:hypothetical protein
MIRQLALSLVAIGVVIAAGTGKALAQTEWRTAIGVNAIYSTQEAGPTYDAPSIPKPPIAGSCVRPSLCPCRAGIPGGRCPRCGGRFTLRDFHDRALRESGVPLPDLEKLLLP